jgi:beta-lactamase superfamily II metal-dependent hydrolase
MVLKYVGNSVQKLYDTETSSTSMYSLIMGDDVDETDEIEEKRRRVNWRKKTGWVDEGSLQDKAVLEVYYIDVGQGDSTFIVTPARKTVLIDGGENFQALKFLSWKYRLSESDPADKLVIDLLVLTHPDEDHINGLIHVLNNEKIQVNKIMHSGVGVYKTSKYKNKTGELTPLISRVKYLKTIHNDTSTLVDGEISDKFKEWKDAINSHQNLIYERVDSSTPSFKLGDPDVTFEILGPIKYTIYGEDTLRWFTNCSKNRNGNSVIVKLTYNKTVFLFSGDVNEISQKKYCEDENVDDIFDSHVLKAPHHGSHEYHDEWLMAVNPQISIISSGDQQDHGHPRAVFLGKIGQVSRSKSPLLFSTEIARTFMDVKDNLKEEFEVTNEVLENIDDDLLEKIRLLYKKRLNGMINVRSDGESLFTARRISSGQRWEYYDNIAPVPRTDFKKNND